MSSAYSVTSHLTCVCEFLANKNWLPNEEFRVDPIAVTVDFEAVPVKAVTLSDEPRLTYHDVLYAACSTG